jgi:adhesin/invasin
VTTAPAVALGFVACGGDDLVLPHDAAPGAIEAARGDRQSGTVAAALRDSIVVLVTDDAGRPMPDVPVEFVVPAGSGGSLVPGTAVTGDDGQAGAKWTLGEQAGTQSVDARVAGASQIAVRLTATARADAAASVAAASGDGQSATVGTALGDSLVVRVTDAFGNPVSGATVDWDADPGSISPRSVETGADGLASARRVLGAAAGTQTAAASAPGLVGSPVIFTHNATPGSAASLVMVSGDGQSAAPGAELPDPLVVRLVDGAGNPLRGRAVTWIVGLGGGSVSPTTGETDADGLASARLTLGPSAGPNEANAVVSGVEIVTFAAMATGDGGGGGGGGGESGDHLVFQVQPSDARQKERITPSVVVALVDRSGAVVRDQKVSIELELVSGSGKLGGKTEHDTRDGVATFDDLKVDEPGEGKVLRASAREHAELGTVESRAFRIEGKD